MAKKLSKLLVGVALAGAAVGGGIAYYNKMKKAEENWDDDFDDFQDDFEDDLEGYDTADDSGSTKREYVDITKNATTEESAEVFTEAVSDTAEAVTDAVKDTTESVVNTAADAVKTAADAVSDTSETVADRVRAGAQAVAEHIENSTEE